MNRVKLNLNKDWKFIRHDQPLPGYKGVDDSSWQNISVPHDWSVKEDFSRDNSSGTGYLSTGIGWYRRRFLLPENFKNGNVYITFEGVYNNSQVWCNSYYINKRPYGYSSFTYNITDFVEFGKTENVISVKVNHKDSADSRWFTGSGIYRNVYLTVTDKLHFDLYGLFFTTAEVKKESALINVNLNIANDAEWEREFSVSLILKNNEGDMVTQTSSSILNVSENSHFTQDYQLSLQNPELWSPHNPYLYELNARILDNMGVVIDEISLNAGIRFFEFSANKGFFLNGESLKMKGVCLHHDAGCLGAAVPRQVWRRRLLDLKEMGCNAIRCSHNPPAPDFLDLCDEIGFLVQDEAFDEWEGVKNKWWQGHNVYPPKHFGYYEDFPEWHQRDIQDMVKRDRNHPSIIFWSIGNEIDYPNDPYCHSSFNMMNGNNDANKPINERLYDPDKPNAERLVTIAKELVRLVKECDSTRPVTAALAFPELSNLTGLSETLDVIGYNYKEHLYKEDTLKWPDRVIYGSENGKTLKDWITVRDNENICGQFLWTGIDFLGEAKGWPVRVSCAGLINTAGYKKASYFYRKSFWNSKPMIQMVTVPLGNRDLYDGENFHWNYDEGERVIIRVYSNCPRVELLLNGKSLGEKKPSENENFFAEWETSHIKGEIKAVTHDQRNHELSSILITSLEPDHLTASPYLPQPLENDAYEIIEVDIGLEDKKNVSVFHTDLSVEVILQKPHILMGLENGNPQDLEPYHSNIRMTFHGKLKAYIKKMDTCDLILMLRTKTLKELVVKI